MDDRVGIVEFIEARLSEDERVAQVCEDLNGDNALLSWLEVSNTNVDAGWAHLARFDPARVLREVAAKRRLLEIFAVANSRSIAADAWLLLRDAVFAAAEVWSDHPAFRAEWSVPE